MKNKNPDTTSAIGTPGFEPKRVSHTVVGLLVTGLLTVGVLAGTGFLSGLTSTQETTVAGNPVAVPSPSGSPRLTREYIYAGGKLVAVDEKSSQPETPADIAVWRPSNGYWIVMGQAGSQATAMYFGMAGDKPLMGDYDGDGKTDFTVYREGASAGAASTFYVWPSGPSSWWGYYWGVGGDKAVVGDFDGDGRTDYAIVRQESGSLGWWVLKSSDGNYIAGAWGIASDTPAVADYDGDGRADFAVYRPGDTHFYVIRSGDGTAFQLNIGQSGEVVSSDYDGDGKADPAIYVTSTATWYVHQSTTNSIVSSVWGNNGSSGCTGSCSGLGLVPVHNDYDLDGKTDLAVWTPTTNAIWTIKRSSNGTTRTETFGTTGDIPVPAFYRR